jgi:hypothetical protein
MGVACVHDAIVDMTLRLRNCSAVDWIISVISSYMAHAQAA